MWEFIQRKNVLTHKEKKNKFCKKQSLIIPEKSGKKYYNLDS